MNTNAYYGSNIPNSPIYNGNMVKEKIVDTNYQIPTYDLPVEQSYFESILKFNRGKEVKVYLNFPNSNDYKDIQVSGIIESSGHNYIIISEPSTGKWHLLPLMYIDYITFDEKINYS